MEGGYKRTGMATSMTFSFGTVTVSNHGSTTTGSYLIAPAGCKVCGSFSGSPQISDGVTEIKYVASLYDSGVALIYAP